MFYPNQQSSGYGPFPFSQAARQPVPYQTNFPYQTPGGTAGRGGVQGLLQRFIQPAGGGASQLPAAGSKLTSTLGNVQQAIKMAQSAMPIVQQYGPMIKNIPMMINMLKAFNADEEEEEGAADTVNQDTDDDLDDIGAGEQKETEKHSVAVQQENLYKIEAAEKIAEKTEIEKKSKKNGAGQSLPKLYI
ncbi:VrrA/YqfQ family protein [Sediminibacillus albus]|nr:VrrA/YqfQ family protein [Sediminibacillus albus]